MPLTIAEIQEILTRRPSAERNVIPKAALQENRLRFHSETIISERDASRSFTKFAEFVRTLLPDDKYQMFLALFQFPVNTVTLTDQMYTALGKMFDGRNPVFRYDFASPEDAEDWQNYRSRVLKTNTFWKTRGFETMKTAINSIVVTDVPSEQATASPEPYFYFLSINDVIDFENNSGDVFDWIIFRQAENRIAVFDDGFFRLFETKHGATLGINPEPITESEHDLGYCPARWFWTTPVSYRQPHIKKSPLSNILGKLDMLLFFEVSNEHLNLYGRYPIYSAFAADCDYVHDQTGEYCDNGLLRARDGNYLIEGTKPKGCPVCQKRRLDGPGSFVEIDPPSRQNDNADLRNPVQITSIDRDSLDYNNEDIDRRRNELYVAVTGNRGMSINDKAVNEKQVVAIFEGLEAALQMPQRNFEEVMTWVDETICRLRYGNENFIGASISLGTEHYIMSPSQLMEMYNFAKESSFSVSTLDMLEDRYYETEYRNNPEQLQRQTILNNLDPFRHRSVEDVAKMYSDGHVSYQEYMVKANFSSFVMRFERENLPVTEFGVGVSFDQRITNIKEALRGYAEEMNPSGSGEDSLDLKTRIEMYAMAVRSGSVTPQTEDEIRFREELGLAGMSEQVLKAWVDDQGVKTPITLKSKTETDAKIETAVGKE